MVLAQLPDQGNVPMVVSVLGLELEGEGLNGKCLKKFFEPS
jgi:hypothetical protein